MSHEQKENESQSATERESAVRAAFRACFRNENGEIVLAVLAASAGCSPGQRQSPFLPSAGGAPICPITAALRAGRQSILDDIGNILASAEDQAPAKPRAKR